MVTASLLAATSRLSQQLEDLDHSLRVLARILPNVGEDRVQVRDRLRELLVELLIVEQLRREAVAARQLLHERIGAGS